MNARFGPRVSFNKDRIRSRLEVVRNQWKRRKAGLQVSQLPPSETLPISILDKYSETISALVAAEPSSSSSVQPTEMDPNYWTNDEIIGYLVKKGVHAKKIVQYQKALKKNKEERSRSGSGWGLGNLHVHSSVR